MAEKTPREKSRAVWLSPPHCRMTRSPLWGSDSPPPSCEKRAGDPLRSPTNKILMPRGLLEKYMSDGVVWLRKKEIVLIFWKAK